MNIKVTIGTPISALDLETADLLIERHNRTAETPLPASTKPEKKASLQTILENILKIRWENRLARASSAVARKEDLVTKFHEADEDKRQRIRDILAE